jgi:KRAB domain-containing zinc finger protein
MFSDISGITVKETSTKNFQKKRSSVLIDKKVDMEIINHYKCKHCNMKFISIDNLNEHVNLTHQTVYCKLLCTTCYKSKRNITNHVNVHGDDRQFKCEECSITFKSGFYVTLIYKRIVQKNTFQCKECGKIFKSKKKLQSHTSVLH